jgi:hypothetical protein
MREKTSLGVSIESATDRSGFDRNCHASQSGDDQDAPEIAWNHSAWWLRLVPMLCW